MRVQFWYRQRFMGIEINKRNFSDGKI